MKCLWLLVVVHGLVVSTCAAGTNAPGSPRTSGRILVQPRAGVDPGTLDSWAVGQSIETVRTPRDLGPLRVMHSAHRNERELIAQIEASGLVEFAEPDYLLTASITPNDPALLNGTAWAASTLELPSAWDRTHLASHVVVAVIDSGIRLTHEDLRDNLWSNPGEIAGNGIDDDGNGIVDDVHGINAILGTGDPVDDVGHGTHVAGILGAVGNNGKGSAGVAWSVQLMALKFLGANGEGATSDAIACIDYARSKGAHIINASWGGTGSSQALRNAIARARNAGIIVVAAAGNEGLNMDRSPSYPAAYSLDNIVSVGASTASDALASFSNYGASTVDLLAPGVGIYSTWNSGDRAYASLDGTSMAAPFVTGALALLKGRFPGKSAAELIGALLQGADATSGASAMTVTGGRLNVDAALRTLAATVPPGIAVTLSGDLVALRLSGPPGSVLTVERSFDLIQWQTWGTVTLDDGGSGSLAGSRYIEGMAAFRAVLN